MNVLTIDIPRWRVRQHTIEGFYIEAENGIEFLVHHGCIEAENGIEFLVHHSCPDCNKELERRVGTTFFPPEAMPLNLQREYWCALSRFAARHAAGLEQAGTP